MTILECKKGEGAIIELDCSELNDLNNVLHNFIYHKEQDPGDPNETRLTSQIHILKSNIGIARDLSHYGHIDCFSAEKFVKSREKAKELEKK